jgi:SNF2 family DNA or RNA helicase
MPKLTYHCPICSKELKLEREFRIGESILFQYKCGHVFSKDILHIDKSDLDFTSVDGSGKCARSYQEDGVKFILESGFNACISYQMRLGKTPTSLLALKNRLKERMPALIIVRPANLWQWVREFKTWTSALPSGIFPIVGGTDSWIPIGFSAYIISMDLFGSQGKCKCGHKYHEQKCAVCNRKGKTCLGFESDGNSILDKLKKIDFKLLIVDEAHSFKNTESNRSQNLVNFIQYLNTGEEQLEVAFTCGRCLHEWKETGHLKYDKRIGNTVISKSSKCPQCGNYCYINQQHRIGETWISPVKNSESVKKVTKLLTLANDKNAYAPERELAQAKADEIIRAEGLKLESKKPEPVGLVLLTGTPIKNRADEYFVPLNLMNPEKFSSLERFRRQWLVQDSKGRFSRVNPNYMAAFKWVIEPYVLRLEKEDVYKELPPLVRNFTVISPEWDEVKDEYNKILDKMELTLADKANPSYWDLKDDMMSLRRICGMMKVPYIADYLNEQMEQCNGDMERYAVGIHHISVRDVLKLKLGGDDNVLTLSGADNSDRKDWIMRNFATAPQKILVANMVAGGVGMDFHYVNNVLILERQWSSADEEQFEFRFYNPDLSIKKVPTFIEYIIAKGTIDEFFHDMVEEKRKVFGETIANNWNVTTDSTSFRELLERTLSAGRLN